MSPLGFPELLVILVLWLICLLPFYKIFSKAGYPGLLCLTLIVPLLNVIMLLFLAFSEWPVLKELQALKQRPTP
jgi:glycerol-3-phosphate acyltransferase PlsY